MPVHVRPRRAGEGGKPFKIVEDAGGKVVGESDTRKNAEVSAFKRNEAVKRKRGKGSSHG